MLENSAASITIESPFPDAHYPAVWRWIEPFRHRILDDFSPQNIDDFVAFLQVRSQLPGRTTYGVRRDGDLGGLVVIERVAPDHPTAIAHLLFRKSFWGHKTTIPALTKVFTDVFDSGVVNLRSEVFADNRAIISLITKLGGIRYGLPLLERGKALAAPLPQATIRGGELIDVVGLLLTREALDAMPGSARTPDTRGRRAGGKNPARKGEPAERRFAA